MSLVIGEFGTAGWLAYPPLSGIKFSPGVGIDYQLWALQISGVGTLLTGVNFVTTILKMRAPGMTYFRMPIFVLDVARREPADHRRLPHPHRDAGDEPARPLPRLPLLHGQPRAAIR